MYQTLAERPLMTMAMLGIVVAACVAAWLKTGRRDVLIAAIIGACLVPAAGYLADVLVTDRERIEQIVYEVAAAVENNDVDTAVSYLRSESLRRRAADELSRYRFSMARVNQLRRVDLIKNSFPPEAEVELSVKVDVSERSGALQNVRVVRRLVLKFVKVGDGDDGNGDWKVIDYAHFPITGGADSYSTQFSGANAGY
ncbi:hypothetical protein [Crateriforma conspicua]|uniref:Uncharacterized protein n=1 Tax=Crateriforma conspicua TaxID=2527996 RepID=A0A5C5XXR1_9PLAN|nr:hypothetical protein [Crateriforma conspicua]TWT68137.1 hypothetical protein Pan14r_03760 [Crateriforma conspicua]